MSAATLGTYIPLGGAITGIVPTLNSPPGSVTFTVTGFFTFRTYYFWTDTISFTGTLVIRPAPSGDPTRPGRILSLSGTTTSLSTTTTGPSPTLAVAGWFLSLVAPLVGGIIQPVLEDKVNQAIDSLVAPGLASLGFRRSPSSVVSARNVVVSGSGIAMSLVLADLFGPAFSPLPGSLRAVVSPAPQANTQQSYTGHRDQLGHRHAGAAGERGHCTTSPAPAWPDQRTGEDGRGGASRRSPATLRPKITFRVDPITHERERIFVSPTLTVSADGFTPITLTLLQDTSDR